MLRLLHRRGFAAVAARGDNFYQLLGLRETFDVPATHLVERFREMQRRWHPDRFGTSSKEERAQAATMSARINEAYATLRKPATRAKHLLHIRGEGQPPALDPAFLSWVVETREAILEASSDVRKIDDMRNQMNEATATCLADLAYAFEAADLSQASARAAELQYLQRIESALANTEVRPNES